MAIARAFRISCPPARTAQTRLAGVRARSRRRGALNFRDPASRTSLYNARAMPSRPTETAMTNEANEASEAVAMARILGWLARHAPELVAALACVFFAAVAFWEA